MNIKVPQQEQKLVNLNEAKKVLQSLNTNIEEVVLKTKSKQFEFECGIVMARININVTNRFGLKWHYDNSTNLEEFLSSVEKFIKISGNVLTAQDTKLLSKQYNKYALKFKS